MSWKRLRPSADISTGERSLIQTPLFSQQATLLYLRLYRLRGSKGGKGSGSQSSPSPPDGVDTLGLIVDGKRKGERRENRMPETAIKQMAMIIPRRLDLWTLGVTMSESGIGALDLSSSR